MAPCIFVIDDDKPFCQVLTETLREVGYEVIGAVDAAKVLKLLELVEPDLILLDLHMPGINGPTFIQKYREREGSKVPIILVSADDDVARVAIEVGADSYLEKPLETDQLCTLVNFYTHS